VYEDGRYLKERHQVEDLRIEGRILQYMLTAYDGRVWTEFIWLRIGTSGRLL
jgi:hypothetical protein